MRSAASALMEADERDRSPLSGRWAARGAILQQQLNELTASLSGQGSPSRDDFDSYAGEGDRSAPWPPTAMSLSSDRLPYSFKLLHHDDLPSPRWQAGLLGPTPKPDYPTIPGMPGWAREPLLPLPEPEPGTPPPRPVGVGFREHIGGEDLLNYLGEVLQSPSAASRKQPRQDSTEHLEEARPRQDGREHFEEARRAQQTEGSDEDSPNESDSSDVEGMPRGTIARARWRYRQKEMELAMARLQSAPAHDVAPEPAPEIPPGPEQEPQPEPEPEPGPEPEPEPQSELQPERGSTWPRRLYSSPEKNETHAQWEDRDEHRANCTQIKAQQAAGTLSKDSEMLTLTAAASALTPPRRGLWKQTNC